MGNTSSVCHVTNYSKRNVRVFVTDKQLAIDAVITSESNSEEHNSSVLSTDKKFCFWKGVDCIRVLASESQEVKYEPQHYVNIFVENEEDENICSKQIMHNVVQSAPFTVLLYDV